MSVKARFNVFENKVLRKIYEPVQDSESGEQANTALHRNSWLLWSNIVEAGGVLG